MTDVKRVCGNCGTLLLGEHCYVCGQPVKGLVRHFSSIVGDIADTVFNVDSRIFRTLGPLLLRPGFLTIEYFAGRRVRYVSPVRLFFFLCIAAFFALQLAIDPDFNFDGESKIASAQTVEEVERLREAALAELRQARLEVKDAPGARAGIEIGIAQVETQANVRIAWLQRRQEALARGEAPPPEPNDATPIQLGNINGKPWHPQTNPIGLPWLNAPLNDALNRVMARLQVNGERIRADPRLLIQAFMENLPVALFVMLPLFALLLKVFYLFKRRLYMEHLIVALHSHAFLCLALLLIALAVVLQRYLGEGALGQAVSWFEIALLVWMPLYLLIMQRRVYRQNWVFTLFKYGLLGIAYSLLLTFGLTIALVASVMTI